MSEPVESIRTETSSDFLKEHINSIARDLAHPFKRLERKNHQLWMEYIFPLIDTLENVRVIAMGVGEGGVIIPLVTHKYASQKWELYGVDIDSKMIKGFDSNISKLQGLRSSSLQMFIDEIVTLENDRRGKANPFYNTKELADVVTVFDCIHEICSIPLITGKDGYKILEDTLRSIVQVTKPGGYVVVADIFAVRDGYSEYEWRSEEAHRRAFEAMLEYVTYPDVKHELELHYWDKDMTDYKQQRINQVDGLLKGREPYRNNETEILIDIVIECLPRVVWIPTEEGFIYKRPDPDRELHACVTANFVKQALIEEGLEIIASRWVSSEYITQTFLPERCGIGLYKTDFPSAFQAFVAYKPK